MLKRILVAGLTLGLVAFVAMAGNGHEYQGLKKCGMCHKGEKKGNILEGWEAGPHAKAYQTLVDAGEQENAECLRCHVTGYGEDAALTAKLDVTEGVTCEACHGAGADYGKMSTMKDHDAAVAAGLVANPKEHCTDCHNPDSPTYKEFHLEERWEEIKHSIPE